MLTKFEHKTQKLASNRSFVIRLLKSLAFAMGFATISLVIGMAGYMLTEDMETVDAFLNAAMILSGMGPAQTLSTSAGKIFAGFYALFSGLMVVAATAVILAPIFHRILHQFHVDDDEKNHGD